MIVGGVNPSPAASVKLTPECQPKSRPFVPITAHSRRPSERGCGLLAPYSSVHSGNSRISGEGSSHVSPPSRVVLEATHQPVIGSVPPIERSIRMRPSTILMSSSAIRASPPIARQNQPG